MIPSLEDILNDEVAHRRMRIYEERAGRRAAAIAFAPSLGLLAAFIALSLFDPWIKLPPVAHAFAFICLLVVLISGIVSAFHAWRRGWATAELKWVRYLLLLPLLTLGLYAAAGDWDRRLALAFQPGLFFSPPDMTVSAAIQAPSYTGGGLTTLPVRSDAAPVTVPVGSMLRVEARDLRWPPHLAWGREVVRLRPSADGSYYQLEGELKADGDVRLLYNGRSIASWRVNVSPDGKPQVRLVAQPTVTARQSLRLEIEAGDDYGVEHLALKLRRADGTGPEHVVDLPSHGARAMDEVIYRNLLFHPLAGEEVELAVAAMDGRYQEGVSKPVTVTLPRRVFTNPVALSLNAARTGILSGTREEVERATRRLGGLSETAAFPSDATVQLGLRTAYRRLKAGSGPEVREDVARLLWDLALRADDGSLSQTENELHDVLAALDLGLRRGSAGDKVRDLIRQLAYAFEAYGRARSGSGRAAARSLDQSTRQMSERDAVDWAALRRFVTRLDELAVAGDRDELLTQIAGLRAGLEERPDLLLSADAYRRFVIASYARRLIDEVVREQRLLLSVAVGPALAVVQEQNEPLRLHDAGRKRLMSNQSALREALKSLIGQLDRAGMPYMDAFYRARDAMDDVVKSLEAGAADGVASAQVQVITALDLAAKALANVPSPLSVDNEGRMKDPLGRPLPPLNDAPESGIERAIRGARP